MPANRQERRPPSARIELTAAELKTLVAVSDHYQRSLGPMRHLVRLTSSKETRGRFRFLDEESTILRRFAESMLADAEGATAGAVRIEITLRALVAFWGRLLASTTSPRSRRRLKAEEIESREMLAERLEATVRQLRDRNPSAVDAEIQTRRPVEQEWMRDRLNATPAGDAPPLQ